jgi:hypothetical protein
LYQESRNIRFVSAWNSRVLSNKQNADEVPPSQARPDLAKIWDEETKVIVSKEARCAILSPVSLIAHLPKTTICYMGICTNEPVP